MKTKNQQEALKEILEIRKKINKCPKAYPLARASLQVKAQEIADEFKGGCGERKIIDIGEPKYMLECGRNWFCPDCQAKKEDCDKIQEENKEMQNG